MFREDDQTKAKLASDKEIQARGGTLNPHGYIQNSEKNEMTRGERKNSDDSVKTEIDFLKSDA